ncbi:MAG: hypothetical protein LBK73_06635 [Treponema sp.]|nr:hypothetical protein [Treponema sp.]
MTWFLKEYALKALTGDEYSQVEMDTVYLIPCYCLKLYYGKRFNCAVWKRPGAEAGLSLLEAVEELEAYAFSENSAPSEMMDFHYTWETMRQYCTGMYSSSLNERLKVANELSWRMSIPPLAYKKPGCARRNGGINGLWRNIPRCPKVYVEGLWILKDEDRKKARKNLTCEATNRVVSQVYSFSG